MALMEIGPSDDLPKTAFVELHVRCMWCQRPLSGEVMVSLPGFGSGPQVSYGGHAKCWPNLTKRQKAEAGESGGRYPR